MRLNSSRPDSASSVPVVSLPACKSSAQRAVMLAALADGPSELRGFSVGADTQDLLQALRSLGWDWHLDQGSLHMTGRGGPKPKPSADLDLGEGASTLRFLAPMLAAGHGDWTLQLGPSLARRPQQDLLDLLEQLGASAILEGGQMSLQADGWQSSSLQVPTAISSQFLSGLLLAAGDREMDYHFAQSMVSAGYLDLTKDWLARFRGPGCLEQGPGRWRQRAGYGTGQVITLPADASAMVFFAVAAVLLQQEIALDRGWHPMHPDLAVLRLLQGAKLLQVVVTEKHWHLQPVLLPAACPQSLSFDLQAAPDAGPALAVLAAGLPQGIRFHGAERLRWKESDRLKGMQALAARAGAELQEQADGTLWVAPAAVFGQKAIPPEGSFLTKQDHRLAMAAGIAELVWGGCPVDDPTVVSKSFPDFWEQCTRLA